MEINTNNLKSSFNREPPVDLYVRVLAKINAKKQRVVFYRNLIRQSLRGVGFLSFIFLGANLAQQMLKAGSGYFLQMTLIPNHLSLLAWSHAVLAIVESIPSELVVGVLTCLILTLLLSINRHYSNAREFNIHLT